MHAVFLSKLSIALVVVLICAVDHAIAQHCVVNGVPAVCRSAKVERQAQSIAQRRCPRCDPRSVKDAIYSMQMNRGPYRVARELARDALLHVRRGG